MGYNVTNWGTVTAGAGIWVTYMIGNGDELHAQFAQGSPDFPNGDLASSLHRKGTTGDGKVWYGFFLNNFGSVDMEFSLDGGGLT